MRCATSGIRTGCGRVAIPRKEIDTSGTKFADVTAFSARADHARGPAQYTPPWLKDVLTLFQRPSDRSRGAGSGSSRRKVWRLSPETRCSSCAAARRGVRTHPGDGLRQRDRRASGPRCLLRADSFAIATSRFLGGTCSTPDPTRAVCRGRRTACSIRTASRCSTTRSSSRSRKPVPKSDATTFMFMALPLKVARGTGSPVNPIALF